MTVTCETCETKSAAIFMTQGLGCAIDVFIREGKLLALGSYGSRLFDGQMFEIVGDARTNQKLGLMCDDCMAVLVEKGQAIKVADGQYFGLGAD